jgi:hypothetical protein
MNETESVMPLSNPTETAHPALAALAGRMEISAADVAALRAAFAERPFARADALALFALEAGAATPPEWTPFFVSAITDLVVWNARPTGVIEPAAADWLMAQADAARTVNCFALLVNVLAEAHRIPAWLPAAVRARAAQWPGVKEALRSHMAQAA